jgi:NAD-dependent deacetylase
VQKATDVPHCTCGGIVRPDVVLYEESLNETVLEKSVEAIESADMLIVGGTSLVVYPAAGLVRYFRGKHLVVINMSPTSLDKNADLLIDEKIGEVFSKLK